MEPVNLTCGDAGFTCAYRNTLSWKNATLPLPMENNPAELERLRAEDVVIIGTDARPSFGALLFNFLPYFLLIGFWIFLFRQMQAGGNKAFSFGKSKAKLLTGDGVNQGVTSDHTISMANAVPVSTGVTTYLRFNHAYGFEDGTDVVGVLTKDCKVRG